MCVSVYVFGSSDINLDEGWRTLFDHVSLYLLTLLVITDGRNGKGSISVSVSRKMSCLKMTSNGRRQFRCQVTEKEKEEEREEMEMGRKN